MGRGNKFSKFCSNIQFCLVCVCVCVCFQDPDWPLPRVFPLRASTNSTRGACSRLILLGKCRSVVGHNSISVKGAAVWNELPLHIRNWSGSLEVFKKKLKLFLLQGTDGVT